MTHLTSFFLLCSGANREFIAQCPSEKTKYAGLGATIFFTGVFAALSASYALYFVFNNALISIAFGLVWGLMIFNLDRFIVSTMRKRGKPLREFGAAVPRLIVAVIISIVIALPLELKIFEKEINPELVLMEQTAFAQQEQSVRDRFLQQERELTLQLEALDKAVAGKTKQRDELMRIAQEEADGTGGSRIRNLGPIYKIKKSDADQSQRELDQLKTETAELRSVLMKQLAVNDSLRRSAMAQLTFAHRDGPAARMEALEKVKAKSPPVATASLFIMLLILAVETAPVFVKLISPKGPYDNLVNIQEFTFSTRELDEVASVSALTRKKVDTLPSSESGFLSRSLDKQLDIPPNAS